MSGEGRESRFDAANTVKDLSGSRKPLKELTSELNDSFRHFGLR